MAKRTVMTLELTEMDVEILLAALGAMQSREFEAGRSGRGPGILMEKIYRKIGARLGKA